MAQKRGMSGEDSEEKFEFPVNLDEFGFYFNDEGQLRNKQTDEPYDFIARADNHKYNQKRYEALGDIITNHIYELLERRHGLKRHYLPDDTQGDEPRSFLYHSSDALTNEKMMVLIHGSGAVRAGQWARRLIINDCLDSGTQLPFISRAIDRGYSVIVANTNINKQIVDGEDVEIRGNGSPEEHVETLWSEIVQQSKAKHIAIVAHSYGGVCTLELANNHIKEFWEKVFAIALTDSVHSFSHQKSEDDVIMLYKQRARNWASSYDRLDAPLETKDFCPTVSAGTDRHDYTSYSSMESIFKFFEEKYASDTSPGQTRSDIEGQSGDKLSAKDTDKTEASISSPNKIVSGETKGSQESRQYSQPMSQDATGSGDTRQESQPMSQDPFDNNDVKMDSQGDDLDFENIRKNKEEL